MTIVFAGTMGKFVTEKGKKSFVRALMATPCCASPVFTMAFIPSIGMQVSGWSTCETCGKIRTV